MRRLTLTPQGQATLAAVVPAMQRAQARILAPLAPAERELFMSLLQRLVRENNDCSRAPAASA
ncbi:hypothetical protein [Tepidimonas sp.]|uniref:hypothetical protein n=1 Tax=Tepidimonas sp. TaxID=2002775 RepID=UPI002FE050B1